MEVAEWSVTSLIYCWALGLVLCASLWRFIFPLPGQDRKFTARTDYGRIYTGVFSPILSSVITVFRLRAGNYCLSRLQPNIHTGRLWLIFFSDLRYKVVFKVPLRVAFI